MDNVLKLNGITCEFSPGDTILEVARRNNIHIPTLCYLNGAPPTGACRICIVEVKGAPGPVASCSTPAVNDMEIFTETPRIVKARKTVIELLLISGNHNCAVQGKFPHEWTDFQQEVEAYDEADDICTAYGECQLQALAYKYMVTDRTLDRIPTKYPLEYDDPLIGRDFSRCILCGRCVQACNEIQVNNSLSHGYRGNIAKIVVKGDRTLPLSDCVYCGECVQACPVGSLFEKKNRFNYRMWDVKQVCTTCYYCGVGCQLNLYIKDQKIVKVDGVEEAKPNFGRLCFKGRFGFDFIHSKKRLKRPMIRKDGKLVKASWEEALDLIVSKLNEIKEKHGSESIGCLVSTKHTNEDLFQTKKFFKTVLSADNVFHLEPTAYMGIEYEDIKDASTIVVVGGDINRDNPVVASFVKQAVLNGAELIVVDSTNSEISKFAKLQLKDLSELEKRSDSEAIVIHEPGYDISPIKEMENIKIFSLNRENNTLGAYLMDISTGIDSNLSSIKFLYSMGGNIVKNDSIEFLVVQDIFPGKYTKIADVVLPASVWIEYDGTYISSDGRINKVTKTIDSPGEAKPTWWIFRELAKRMGHSWDSKNSREIWEKEIILKDPNLLKINYTLLDEEDVKISIKPDITFKAPPKIPEGFERQNFHKILCQHCVDLNDVIDKRFKEGGQ